MIALIAAGGLALAMGLALVRLASGPTLYDRALAANALVLRGALACAAFAAAFGRGAWVDVAIALVLGALVLNAAVLKFFRARSFQPSLAREEA
jgi:multisubunit Na+/H+ antiporter MnhF subunit